MSEAAGPEQREEDGTTVRAAGRVTGGVGVGGDPAGRVEELVGELLASAQRLQIAGERTRGLIQAIVTVGSDLSLPAVLRRIAESVATLVHARYAALGVLGADGGLADFITVGMTDDEVRAVGSPPKGRGVLGALTRDGRPLRLVDLATHPASVGFPAGHPEMHGFLGVPIRVGSRIFGNLYACDRMDGRPFDDDDEELLVSLAAAAGVAIDNAQLYERVREREARLAGIQEITNAVLGGADRDELATIVARCLRSLFDADLAVFATLEKDGIVIRGADGLHAVQVVDMKLRSNMPLARRLTTADAAVLVDDAGRDPVGYEEFATVTGIGPAMLVPLATPSGRTTALIVGNRAGATKFTPRHAQLLEEFSQHTRIALELREAQSEVARLSVLEDRERIAADLHDKVIQRLFATGMTLQSVERLVDNPEAGGKIRSVVDALDETIREIRAAIFELTTRSGPPTGLRSRLATIVEEYTPALGFACKLQLQGDLDAVAGHRAAEALVATLREALSNAARHARATEVEVTITLDEALVLEVRDNGIGISDRPGRRSGLANMAQRARDVGGVCTLSPAWPHGTIVHWKVPVPA